MPPINILLIEDEAIDIVFLKRNFVNCFPQYKCEIVSTIKDAKAYIASSTFQIIVSDLNLPDGDAFEVLEEASKGHIPVIIVTSKGTERIAEDLLKKGAADYLIKDQLMGEHLMLLPEIIEETIAQWK